MIFIQKTIRNEGDYRNFCYTVAEDSICWISGEYPKKNYNASESLVRNIILNSNNWNNVFFKQVYKDW